MTFHILPIRLLLIVTLTTSFLSCQKNDLLPEQSPPQEWFARWKNSNPYKAEVSTRNFERNSRLLWDRKIVKNDRIYVPVSLEPVNTNDSFRIYKFITYTINPGVYKKSTLLYFIVGADTGVPGVELLTDVQWQKRQGAGLTIIEREINDLTTDESYKNGHFIAVKKPAVLSRNLPPSGNCVSEIIDWYWQTFIDGILVDEVYLFSTEEWICPSGSGSGGGGTDTTSKSNPCDSVKKLASNTEFRDKMVYLKGKTSGNKEHAFYYRNTGSTTTIDEEEFEGVANVLGVGFNDPTYKIDGIMHNHFFKVDSSQSIYSYGDIWTIIDYYTKGLIADPYTFSAGLPTQNGNQYLLKIGDVAKFSSFASSYSNIEMIKTMIFFYHLKPDKVGQDFSAYNEIQFLKFLNQRNTGLVLFKGNASMNNWQSLQLNASNQIETIPCN